MRELLGRAGCLDDRMVRPEIAVSVGDRAHLPTEVKDLRSSVAVAFALRGADPGVRFRRAESGTLAREALGRGTDVVVRVEPDRVEDFVYFERRPALETLVYELDVRRVAGLRLIERTLELLDAHGAPRLRMEPPWVVGSDGRRSEAQIEVVGCAVSTDPGAPFGKPPTRPGAPSCELHVSWREVAYPALVDPAWASAATLNNGRGQAAIDTLGATQVVVAGGCNGNFCSTPTASAEVYSLIDKSWSNIAPMPSAHIGPHVKLQNGSLLFAGGSGGAVLAATYILPVAGPPWTTSGNLNVGRRQHTLTVLPNGDVLAAGGLDGASSPLASAERYGGSTWSATGPLPSARSNHSAVLLANGRVLVAGGYEAGGTTASKTAAIYDPTTGTWAAAQPMLTARANFVLVAHGSGAIATGGITCEGCGQPHPQTTELYNGTSWQPLANMAFAQASGGEMLSSGRLLLAGEVAQAQAYFPSEDAWKLAGALSPGRWGAALTALPGGKAMIAGGVAAGTGAVQKVVEIYDPYANGAACSTGGECASGFCADGVCCDVACTASCLACSAAKKGSGIDGVCGSVATGTDPDADCPASAPTTCGNSGGCDGAGKCKQHAAGIDCGSPSCAATILIVPKCDGKGACAPQQLPCAPYGCTGNACDGSCVSAPCAPGFWCSAGACNPQADNGSLCSKDEECKSGQCYDGYCCGTKCDKQCEACDVKGSEGTCTAVVGDPHGARPACPAGSASDPCKEASCDGADRTTCAAFVGSLVACRQADCQDGVATLSAVCDGKGACPAAQTKNCEPFTCGALECATECSSDAACAPGYRCDLSSQKCVAGASCQDEHTSVAIDGTPTDCSPFKCASSGSCAESCTSADDCLSPYVCDENKQCVKAPSEGSDDSGCGCRAAGREGASHAGWVSLVAWLALARFRGRRTPRAPRR
ncbi:MAG: kelch repeat-containing protein [Polyangiaceae bacterium]